MRCVEQTYRLSEALRLRVKKVPVFRPACSRNRFPGRLHRTTALLLIVLMFSPLQLAAQWFCPVSHPSGPANILAPCCPSESEHSRTVSSSERQVSEDLVQPAPALLHAGHFSYHVWQIARPGIFHDNRTGCECTECECRFSPGTSPNEAHASAGLIPLVPFILFYSFDVLFYVVDPRPAFISPAGNILPQNIPAYLWNQVFLN